MDMNVNRDWSSLPEEILSEISKNFPNSYIDNLRLRSVCSSWRSLLPPFRRNLSFSLQLPFPIFSGDPINADRGGFFSIRESTVYLLESLFTSSSDETPTTCLIKVAEKNHGKMILLNPLTKHPLEGVPKELPNVLNLMDFHVYEVSKAYHLDYRCTVSVPIQYDEIRHLSIDKVVLSQTDYRILAIRGTGDLCSLKLGDQVWTVIRYEPYHHFNDIIHYKGKFYVVDSNMVVLVIDESSLELVRVIEPPLNGSSIPGHTHLVESSGDLFLIMQVDTEDVFRMNFCLHTEMKIFKLQGSGSTWESVFDLGDQVLFLGLDCNYSISAPHSTSFEENSIYFTKRDDRNYDRPRFLKDAQMFVFNLKDASLKPTYLGQ